ncbi:MAG: hypothetical protein IJM05_02900 [Bacteroidales bacterium]|nr:hypothetical protein [Bacteroidales bacterium]
MDTPKGSSPEDIKTRKKLIGDFYAQWIANHPDKKIWNKSLGAYIHVKYLSINETRGHASISYESTMATMHLTEILQKAIVSKRKPAKANDKNQKAFDEIIFLYYKNICLLVGHQKSTNEFVQYCITAKK